MNQRQTDVAIPQAVSITEQVDVGQRLKQLQTWKQAWELEDTMLEQRVMQLDDNNPIAVQKGAQIASLRRRIQLNMVKEPLEISPELIEQVGYQVLHQNLVQQFAGLTKEDRRLWLSNLLFILTPELRNLNNKIN